MGLRSGSCVSRWVHHAAFAAFAFLAGSGAAWAQVSQVPGTQPGKPPPGRPEPAVPDFAPPQPNKGVLAPAAGVPGEERPQFVVGAIVIRYEFDHPQLPAVDDLQKTEV